MDLSDLSVYKQSQNNFSEFKYGLNLFELLIIFNIINFLLRPLNSNNTSNVNLQPIAPPLPPQTNNRSYGYTPPIDPFSSYGSNNFFNGYHSGFTNPGYSNPYNSYSNVNQA
jgi:hypothetical protein